MSDPLYDRIGIGYSNYRRPDPRIAAPIHAALGDARTVLNLGAGTGSYEPSNRQVVAVDPSWTMIEQRAPGLAPVVAAAAEDLPFANDAFEAGMAVLTVHHWTDRERGLSEFRRVVEGPIAVLTADVRVMCKASWLVREYFPEMLPLTEKILAAPEFIASRLGGGRVETVPIPRDCTDGFLEAYWGRPESYLDPGVRASISAFATLDGTIVARGVAALERDLRTGAWDRRHGALRTTAEMDLGYQLVTAYS